MVIKPAHFVAVQSNHAWKRGTASFIAIVAIMSCALVGVPERAQAENCITHTDPNTPARIACMCSLNIRAACVCGTRMLRGDVIEKDGKCVNYEDYKRTQAREAAASDQAWCSKPHTGETPGQCDKYSTTTPQPKSSSTSGSRLGPASAKTEPTSKLTKGSRQPASANAGTGPGAPSSAPAIPRPDSNAESVRKPTPKVDTSAAGQTSSKMPSAATTTPPKNNIITASPGRLTLNSVPGSVKGGFVRTKAADAYTGSSPCNYAFSNQPDPGGCQNLGTNITTTSTPTGSGVTNTPTAPQQPVSSTPYKGTPDTMGKLPPNNAVNFAAQTVVDYVLEAALPSVVNYLAEKLIDAEIEALSDIDIEPPPMGVSPYNQDTLENANPNHPSQEYIPPSKEKSF
jgi:hypothetical protein